ncbi:hypothetical protein MTAT_19330 [Moorella thermoacetica]|uniref:Uncharacterized protein n=1 Tax=Neomoorella thermoacetica TaxID=1525 RepID=A0AAC9HJ37_NEOTH|nr:hypothetical protein [Moorella thermoacetica]AOQ24590.1 hypothetical protein Maut_02160 [Moorella thermoacetica]TYL12691.1 hypothetical protein MTAT_19330 [Moorella thermoacetica]
MTTLLEKYYYALNSFIPYGTSDIRKGLESLYQQLKELNDNNIMAHVPVGYLEEETRNIADRDDYTVRQYTKYVARDNLRDIEKEFDDEDDMLDYADQLQKELVDFLLNSPDLILHRNEGSIDIYYKDEFIETIDCGCACDTEDCAGCNNDLNPNNLDEEIVDELKAVLIDYIDCEDIIETEAYEEENECCWNTVWRYNSEVDEDIARKVGFCLVDFDDGETYFGLQGCGMDLSPLHIAYQALKYGFVQEEFVGKFQDLRYMAYVMGRELFNEVMNRLGLSKFIPQELQSKSA